MEPVKVFLLGGQSNMVGSGKPQELSGVHAEPQSDVKFWSGSAWVDLAPGAGNFGPEIGFGRAMKDALPKEEIYLVKYAARQTFQSLPGAVETQPFGPDVLVYKVGGKMFGTLVIENDVGRINLKCDPERAVELRAEWPDSVLPGYHMNKRHWNTLVLDGRIPSRLARELVVHSHDLVVAALPQKLRREFTAS